MDYPCNYKTSNEVSLIAQKRFIRFSIINFILWGLTAFLGCFVLDSKSVLCKPIVWGVIGSLFLALVVKFVIKSSGWEEQWFDGRATAESIKTATWRYAMGAKPFGIGLVQKDVDIKFIKEIETIITSRPRLQKFMSNCLSSGESITSLMREIRGKNIEERKKIYLKERVQEQRDWYGKKAKYNGEREDFWSNIITVIEVVAIVAACCMLYINNAVFNPIGFITTMVVIFAAWVEVKRFRDLRQSYALASQELALAASLIQNVSDESALAVYVHDTENAISREHTMWCAKRI